MEMIEMELHVHHETERAVLVSPTDDEDDAVWLPLSQVLPDYDAAGYGTFLVPEWLAKEKGLV